MVDRIDEIRVPWNKFPPMRVWRVVRKNWTPEHGPRYVPADSEYKAYPHRSDAVKEARRLTKDTGGVAHRTIVAYLIPCEAETPAQESREQEQEQEPKTTAKGA